MGAFYKPQKVKGHKKDKTFEKKTQNLGNINLIVYIFEGTGFDNRKRKLQGSGSS